MLISSKNTLTDTFRIFDQISGYPWSSQVDTNLAITAGMGVNFYLFVRKENLGIHPFSLLLTEIDQHLQESRLILKNF